MANIAFYGSHNSSFAIEDKGEIIAILEVERFINQKNAGVSQYNVAKDPHVVVHFFMKWIEQEFNISEFENCYAMNSLMFTGGGNTPLIRYDMTDLINAKNVTYFRHHATHANGVFYQSPFDKALIFSFDGGGDDGKYNVYVADRKNGPKLKQVVINPRKQNAHIFHDLGFPYASIAEYLSDIRMEDISTGNLVWSGKVMGLCAYGNAVEEWIPYFEEYFKYDVLATEREETINKIVGDKIGVKFDRLNRIEGQLAYDLAATVQKTFEKCFLEYAIPYLEKYPDLPICLTGGCALNIILNTRLKEEFKREVYVGPNPSDCGLAVGLLLGELRPEKEVDVTYKGTKALDYGNLPEYLSFCNPKRTRIINTESNVLPDYNKISIEEIVQDVIQGNIIGILRGRAEHGPRALGNRSIICNPGFPNMKNILNKKVKNREWYRPFAPVVRLEDVSKYFNWEGESRWMNFCPSVKEEWREQLSATTHVDGTARVQTVTREQNKFLYDLLTELNKQTGVGVLLNTSFNVAGKPILNTIKDAFHVFQHTELDRLIVEDYYIIK